MRVDWRESRDLFEQFLRRRGLDLTEARAFVHGYPELAAMWLSRPLHSRLSLEQVG